MILTTTAVVQGMTGHQLSVTLMGELTLEVERLSSPCRISTCSV
jgi:hypothetical protein